MTLLRDIGEDELISRLIADFPVEGEHGPGDDCAVVDEGGERLRLLKTDAIVERVHFTPETDPAQVGWKAVARVISDFAAMGGRPERFLITVALGGETSVVWAEELYAGMRRCLTTCGGLLAGGETCSVPAGSAAVISVAAEGSVDRPACVWRQNGRPDDVLAVTGRLGRSLAGKHLNFSPRLREGQHLGMAGARAMMDLSDGLAKDLPHLARASGCGYQVEEHLIPRTEGASTEEALGDGEDYELLVAIPPELWPELKRQWPADFAELTRIGTLQETGGTLAGGWDHFDR